MKVGYIRVSTVDQNEARQTERMHKEDIEKIFIDKCSGKDTNRPKLKEMLNFVREGDTIFIHDFSRLARSTKDLLELVEILKNKNVGLVSFKENVDSSTPTGKLMLTMIGAIYEFERDNLLERQKEGIAIAKRNGKYKGRKSVEMPVNFPLVYEEWKNRKITSSKAMEKTGLKKTSFYKIKDEYEENLKRSS